MTHALRDTVAEIDLDAIVENVAHLRERAGAALIAVVKADAYGHGAEAVAPACLEGGAAMLGVATTEEGVLLRSAGVRAPILVMLGVSSPAEAKDAVDAGLEVAVWRTAQLDWLQESARGARRTGVHLKVDTGLTRLGVRPDEVPEMGRAIRRRRDLAFTGVYTHLATSDELDASFARTQLDTFRAVLRALDNPPGCQHALATAGLLALGGDGVFSAVRPGLGVYGHTPAPHLADPGLRPALRLVTRLVRVHAVSAGTGVSYGHQYRTAGPRVIGTVPIGYGDGLPRRAWPGGRMLVRGRLVPIVGRVCMDLVMLDLTEVPGAEEGDQVVLIGEQAGAARSAEDLAAELDTINYEVLTNLHARVPRVYRRAGRVVGVKTAEGYRPT